MLDGTNSELGGSGGVALADASQDRAPSRQPGSFGKMADLDTKPQQKETPIGDELNTPTKKPDSFGKMVDFDAMPQQTEDADRQLASQEAASEEKFRAKAARVFKNTLGKAAEIGKRLGFLTEIDERDRLDMRELAERLLDNTVTAITTIAAVRTYTVIDTAVRSTKERLVDAGLDAVAALAIRSGSRQRSGTLPLSSEPLPEAVVETPATQPQEPAALPEAVLTIPSEPQKETFESAEAWARRLKFTTIDYKLEMGLELDGNEEELLASRTEKDATSWTEPLGEESPVIQSQLITTEQREEPLSDLISSGRAIQAIAEQQPKVVQQIDLDNEFPVQPLSDEELFDFGERMGNRTDQYIVSGDSVHPVTDEDKSPSFVIQNGEVVVDETTGKRYEASSNLPSNCVIITSGEGEWSLISNDPQKLPAKFVRVLNDETEEELKIGEEVFLEEETGEIDSATGRKKIKKTAFRVSDEHTVPRGWIRLQSQEDKGAWQIVPAQLSENFVIATAPPPLKSSVNRERANKNYANERKLLTYFDDQLEAERKAEKTRKPERKSPQRHAWNARQEDLAQQKQILNYIQEKLSRSGEALSRANIELLLHPDSREVILQAMKDEVSLDFIVEKTPSLDILVKAKRAVRVEREAAESEREKLLAISRERAQVEALVEKNGENTGLKASLEALRAEDEKNTEERTRLNAFVKDAEERTAILGYTTTNMRLDPLHEQLLPNDLVKLLGKPLEEVLPEELPAYNERRYAVMRAISREIPLQDLLASIPDEKGEYSFALPLDGLISKNYYLPRSEHLTANERRVWQRVMRVLQVSPARYGLSYNDARQAFEKFDDFVERNTQDTHALAFFQAELATEIKETEALKKKDTETGASIVARNEEQTAIGDQAERGIILTYIAKHPKLGPHIAELLDKRNRGEVLQSIRNGIYERAGKLPSLKALDALEGRIRAEKAVIDDADVQAAAEIDQTERGIILDYIAANLTVGPQRENITRRDMLAILDSRNRKAVLQAIGDKVPFYETVDKLPSLRAIVSIEDHMQAEEAIARRELAEYQAKMQRKPQPDYPLWREGWDERQEDLAQRYEILNYISSNFDLSPQLEDITAADMANLFSKDNRELMLLAIKNGDSLYTVVDNLRTLTKERPAARKGLVARTRERYQQWRDPQSEAADTSLVWAEKIDAYLGRDTNFTEEQRRDAVRMLTKYLKEQEAQNEERRLFISDAQLHQLMDLYRAFYSPTQSKQSELALAA